MRMGCLTFSAEINANDAFGRLAVVSRGEPVVCGEVSIRQGDLVVGDVDGVIVVPEEVIGEAVRLAEEKLQRRQRPCQIFSTVIPLRRCGRDMGFCERNHAV